MQREAAVRIGAGQGAFGESPELMLSSLRAGVDYLVCDSLAETTSAFFALDRRDDEAAGFAPDLTARVGLALPSESFREHVWTCFIRDEAGIEARHRIGVDKIMFEADYPHSDCVWPHSRSGLAEQLRDVPEDEARLIAGQTAAKLLRI